MIYLYFSAVTGFFLGLNEQKKVELETGEVQPIVCLHHPLVCRVLAPDSAQTKSQNSLKTDKNGSFSRQ